MSTENTRLETFLEHCRNRTDTELERQLSGAGSGSERLQQAMRYSVLGGGKRIRPALCMASAIAVGQPADSAIIPACTLELIHAYSLIHDDLPAMDDDELRRGRATTHIAFDEATAILAGDALQTLAFGWLADAPGLDDQVRLAMIRELATASGHLGMVGGQAIDLESVGKRLTIDQLETMHRHKTGALIAASVRMGALTAPDVSDDQLAALTIYSQTLGLAFQVQDDLLDIEGDTTVIGKPQGSDMARAKPTYPSLLGTTGARDYLARLLDSALASLDGFGTEGDMLREMAGYVVARTH
ncbi:polyprenyl synthetase family protein [Marinobacter sp. HL-58]|uniref:polyprenyl synthetase family protein n=1 Tax=Marinobacter sp. HL-58 TaxID=1479237 RepID=UPI0004819481|nr:farnesyl diphosphate synthase [Marinobacter sp. HL-58]KPP98267.1 MAG: farnesyl diphosphate synthase [Marinobacter sp. HL-58]